MKPWLQRRNKLGVYHTLLQELRIEAEDEYKKFLRVSPEVFDELLTLVKPEIEKGTTKLRDPIPSALKLTATIRYLSTGSNYADLIKNSFSSTFLFFPVMLFIKNNLNFADI